MKRLTKEREDGLYEDIDEGVVTNCSNKLGEIEDIEEELGVDLITLFKAFKIIKEKQVDIKWCGGLPPTLQNTYAITQEEIDLLKEVLL